MKITEPTVVPDLPDADYHGHEGSLSASGAKWLAGPAACPAKFLWYRDNPQVRTVFDFGHVAHRLVLGAGADFDVLPFGSYRTKDATAAALASRDAGRVPILEGEYERAQAVAKAVLDDDIAGSVFRDGQPELSLFWPDPETGIVLRARLDWLKNPTGARRRIIGDLKTARTADPVGFGKAAADFGYAMSAANYVDAVRACGLDPDPVFVFVAVEKDPPYVVTTFQATEEVIALGRGLMRQAIRRYAECVETGSWPGYSDGIEQLELPAWYVNRIEESL